MPFPQRFSFGAFSFRPDSAWGWAGCGLCCVCGGQQYTAEMSRRHNDVVRFYSILDRLEKNIGGARRLADSSGRMDWPRRGVYFFREEGEHRIDSGNGPRIVRIGTHALKPGSGTKLWTRLSQHKGQLATGGGNHRGSIFRILVGTALISRHGYDFPKWDVGNRAGGDGRQGEPAL